MHYLVTWIAACLMLGGGDSTVSLTETNTKVEFVGTKPNGKHEGAFKVAKGAAVVSQGDLSKIEVELDLTKLTSDNPKLTQHLKSPDFFNVKEYPTAKFVTKSITKEGDKYQITGELTLVGKTKEISFPATVSTANGKLVLTSEFKMNRHDYGITYGKGQIDDLVALKISINAK